MRYHFEIKITRLILIGLIIMESIAIAINYSLGGRLEVYTLLIAGLIVFSLLYFFLSSNKVAYSKIAFFFIACMLLISIVNWPVFGGYKTHAPFWLNFIFITVIVVATDAQRKIVALLCVMVLLILVLGQLFFPQFIPLPNEISVKAVPYMLLFSSLGIVYMVYTLKENLEIEKEKIYKQNKDLIEKNEIIQEQNKKISQINDTLEQKVIERTKRLEEEQKQLKVAVDTKEMLLSALVKEELFLNSLLDNFPLGVMVFNPSGTLIRGNKKMSEYIVINDITQNINIYEGIFSKYHGLDNFFRNAIEGEALLNYELLLDFSLPQDVKQEKVKEYWINLCVIPVENESNEIPYIIIILEDITERKNFEEALRISELRLNSIIESTSDLIALFDNNYNLLKWNKSYEKSFLEEFHYKGDSGNNIFDIVPDERVLSFWHPFFKRAYNGEHVKDVVQFALNRNEEKYFEISFFPVYKNNEIVGVTQFTRNITTEKLSEIRRLAHEQKLSSILSYLPVIIWTIDKQGCFTYLRGKGLSKLRVKDDELLGININKIYTGNEDTLKKITNILTSTESTELTTTIKGIEFKNYVVPITNKNGKEEFLGVSVDITEQKKTERELRISESYLKSIIDNTKYGIWALDNDRKITLLNRSAAAYFSMRFKTKLNLGDNIFEKIDNEHHEILTSLCNEIPLNKAVAHEYEIKGRYYEIARNPIYINNEIEGSAFISKDITKRKASIEKLKERGRFIDNVVNTVPALVYIHDLKIQWTQYLNHPNFGALNSESPSTLEPETLSIPEICHPADIIRLKKHYKESLEDTSQDLSEIVVRLKNNLGNWRWTMIREVVLSKDANGNPVQLLGIATDINALREKENVLKQISEKLILATKITGLGICLFQPETGLIQPDKQAEKLFQLQSDFAIQLKVFIEQISKETDKILFGEAMYSPEKFKGKKIAFDIKLATEPKQKYFEMIVSRFINEEESTKSVIGVIFDITNKVKQEAKLKQQQLEVINTTKKMAEYKLMAFRSVMNPHFLFNSLNSIQYFIAVNQREEALSYLSLFSKLIRKILNSSITGTILLKEEIETIKYYVELEKIRFENKFEFGLVVDPKLVLDEVEIPSLLIQPFIENAIIHGLYNKQDTGYLKVILKKVNNYIKCTIEDNGIGREKAQKIKQQNFVEHKSVGLMLTKERLEIINKSHSVSTKIIDLYNATGTAAGTKVELLIKI